MYPPIKQYIAKFLQEPNIETGEQPDRWEFQETAEIVPGPDGQYWYSVFWVDEFVDELPCSLFTGIPFPGVPEQYDPNSQCYWVRTWIHPETNWLRARAIQEDPYVASEWSEPHYVPEPSSSTLLLVGIFIYWQLVKITKRKEKIKKRAEI